MVDKTFKSLADTCFKDFAHRNLLFDTTGNKSLSYADGFDLIKVVSKKLTLQGLRKGDMVLTFTPLSIESVLMCWACCYTGVVFVPVDHNWPGALLQIILEETSPMLVLTDAYRIDSLKGIPLNCTIVSAGSRDEKYSALPFFEWIRQPDSKTAERKTVISPDDLALILYTSGSTGIPKGVMLSQQALFNSALLVAKHFGWNCDDVFLNLGDLHSMSGLRNSCFAPLHAGASFIIASSEERNNVLLIIELIHRFGVHYLGVAPTVIRQMNIIFSESRKNQVATLKAVLCTGGPLAKEQLASFFFKYRKPVLNYYGLTETAGLCAGHSFETFDPADNSIGFAVGAELIILTDTDACGEEDAGELLVKSQHLMSGYFKRKNETKQVLVNGCFYTGDIVRKRKDGCFELQGRKRNIVKSVHSELIYLEEIDNALESSPQVKEACACSYSRFEEDEKIVAFIVLKDNSAQNTESMIMELKKHLMAKVGKNRVPWCYYLEEALPRNTAGKIQRQFIKEKLHGYIQSHHKGYF